MKSAAAVQAAAILLLVASAASCEVAKEYSSRVFKPSQPTQKSDTIALRFMEFDSGNLSDTVNLKEFFTKEMIENDSFSSEIKTKPDLAKNSVKPDTLLVENKTPENLPAIGSVKKGATRTKRIRQ